MRPPRPFRHFAYALLATLVVFGVWMRSYQSSDGGWIFWGSIALFLVLVALDWAVVDRLLAGRDATA